MPESPCREFAGYRDKRGYGRRAGVPGRRFGTPLLHRQVWIMAHGPIPEGLVVMHRCDNPSCFRLDHLQLGTQAENLADMRAKGRAGINPASLLSHCKRGHEYNEINTSLTVRGARRCRVCEAYNARRRRWEAQAA